MAAELTSPSDLLGKAWNVFTLRWKTLLLINLVPVALGMAVALFVVILVITTGVFSAIQSGNTDTLGGIILVLIPLFLLVYIAIILLSLWAQIASLIAISQHDKLLTVSKCFELAKSKIWPYFGTAFIVGLLISAGYMLFVIPGIILAVWFSFAGFVVINENKTGLEAALISRGYLRGRFSEIFGRFALIGVIYVGAWLVFAGLQAALGESKETSLLSVLVALISNVVFFIMNLVAIIYAYLIYEDVKRVHGKEVIVLASTKQKYTIFGVVGFVVGIILSLLLLGAVIGLAANVAERIKNQPSDTRFSDEEMNAIYNYSVPPMPSPDDGAEAY